MHYSFLISIVCYNNEAEVIQFIKQVEKQIRSHSIAIVITINSSNDLSLLQDYINTTSVRCFICTPRTNLGYLNGCLYGINELKDKVIYRWAVISNTDIQLLNDDFFDIVEIKYPQMDTWCIAPRIRLGSTGIEQNPHIVSRPSKEEILFRKYVFGNYYSYILYNALSAAKKKLKKRATQNKIVTTRNIFAPHGSFMIICSDGINRMLNDANNIFMFCEEEYVGGIVFENKKHVIYDSELEIIHNEHKSLSKESLRKKQTWYKQSINYIDHRFY